MFKLLPKMQGKETGQKGQGVPSTLQIRDKYYSITYPQNNGSSSIDEKRKTVMLTVSRIGSMKIDMHREIEGKIKTLTIKKKVENYYVIFTAIKEISPPPMIIKDTNPAGVDMGLHSLIILSDGMEREKPRFVKSAKRIAHWQRIIARRNRDSRRREKAKLKLQRKWRILQINQTTSLISYPMSS